MICHSLKKHSLSKMKDSYISQTYCSDDIGDVFKCLSGYSLFQVSGYSVVLFKQRF